MPAAEEPEALDGLREGPRHLTASSRPFRGLRAGLSPWEFREVMWQLPGGGVREGAALDRGS